jgi:hypothetical protein
MGSLSLFYYQKVVAVRNVRFAGLVERMGEKKIDAAFCCRNLKEKDQLKNPARDGEIMVKCNLKAEYGIRRIGFTWSGIVK